MIARNEDIRGLTPEDNGKGKKESFADAKRNYLQMLAKLFAIEILIEEGVVDEDSAFLLEQLWEEK
jgi:hypothetical protein